MLTSKILRRGLAVAGLLAVVPWLAEAQPLPKKRLIKENTDVYTGKVESVDVVTQKIVVRGKILQREFELPANRKYTPSQQTAGTKKLARGSTGTFTVSPSCKISVAGRSRAVLKDLKPGDAVDITFREVGEGQMMADIIASAPPRGDTKPK